MDSLIEIVRTLGPTRAARALGYTPAYMSMVIHGHRPPTLAMLRRGLDAWGDLLDVRASLADALRQRWPD